MLDASTQELAARDAFSAQFTGLATAAGIAPGLVDEYYEAVFSIALIAKNKPADRMITLGVGGAQGSGKSTIAGMIQRILQDVFLISAEVLSIDDYYLTRRQRLKLSEEVHPMLAVRGVPGTHDMQRLRTTIEVLAAGDSCSVPIFSKGEDDRLAEERLVQPSRVLILEGWCWGAQPCDDDDLTEPVNTLEAEQDPALIWRRYVNRALGSADYQWCFANDVSVFLSVPDMQSVFRWRLQQEQQITAGRRVMDASEVRTFIMYYQRIAERMLAEQQSLATVTLKLSVDHGIDEIVLSA